MIVARALAAIVLTFFGTVITFLMPGLNILTMCTLMMIAEGGKDGQVIMGSLFVIFFVGAWFMFIDLTIPWIRQRTCS